MNKLRIALCTDFYPPMLSGVADSVELLAGQLRARGHEVRVYAPSVSGIPPGEEGVFRLPSRALPGTAGAMVVTFPRGATRDLRRFKPDVIHSHTFGITDLWALRAARRLRVPLVTTDHTALADYMHYFKLDYRFAKWAASKFASWFHGHARVVTAPSQYILDKLDEYGMRGNHREVISNAVRTDIFAPLPNRAALKQALGVGERAVLLFGRIAVEKNLLFAVDVFAQVAKEDAEAQLVILGGGPFEAALRAHVEARGLGTRTLWLGVRRGTALVEALNAADVCLATSTSEIQPMATLQAMACELPMVAARAGGFPECVIDGDTGFLVEPTDEAGFAHKLKLLLDDPTLRANFGRAGRALVGNYGPEAIAEQFEAAYQRAIGS